MRIQKLIFSAVLLLLAVGLDAKPPKNKEGKRPIVHYRGECANSESQIDQEINNVRARLLGGGDCWWDFTDPVYVVPKVDPASGQRPVSSIFAGSVWLGGVDPAQNLKLACEDYRQDGRPDFWPGPLTPEGLTDESVCKNWDRHFRVTGDEIRVHLANLAQGLKDPSLIPRGVKGWPGKGNNIFFEEIWGFELPNTSQGLAGFYDANGDFIYNPLDGDYPSIEIRGCPLNRYPDEMIFWIYNDQGGGAAHDTGGKPIQMEVQVQAFGYVTGDELNDMTFQRYKLINRATEVIDSTFFAMWVDADLGCAEDDYIGCDSTKGLMYIYNQDVLDGTSGCDCGDAATYCDKVPILGVDYFRGPLRQILNPDGTVEEQEIGMSSFTYYNNSGIGPHPPPTHDPSIDQQFYNYLTGRWRTGEKIVPYGSGYDPAVDPNDPNVISVNYAFPDPPNDPNGWSMCTANLVFGDRRTIQASGPFRLNPGAVNELIIGVPWVPDIEYDCPDVEQLFRADKLAQGLFDNCFELLDGPDAPDVDWIEMNNQLIAVLTNSIISNNFKEAYKQADFLAPDSIKGKPEAEYKFEGYKIYQLSNPNVVAKDYENQEVARLVYQVDLKNNISRVFNWDDVEGPIKDEKYYAPELAVNGQNEGIRHTFPIAEDRFAKSNDKRLVNHKKYYYSVVAYAHNEYEPFNAFAKPVTGQQRPYLVGRRNIKTFTVIPRPIVDQELNSVYGEGVVVTRLEGQGAGGNFLDLTDESREAIVKTGFDSTLSYKPGRGPLNVNVFNPFEVKDGEYELSIVDADLTDNRVADDAIWQLKNLGTGQVVASERSISELNEQLVKEYGFSITISQTADAGDPALSAVPLLGADDGGAIGIEYEYDDPNNQWLLALPDFDEGLQDFIKTEKLDRDEEVDRSQGLSRMGGFYPYLLCSAFLGNPATDQWFFTPGWTEKLTGAVGNFNNAAVGGSVAGKRKNLAKLPNIDIVFTKNKDLWSRCAVIEGGPYTFTSGQYPQDPDHLVESPPPPGKGRLHFDTRYGPSVGKNDGNNDGKPDPDGAVDAAGKPLTGMGWFPGYAVDVETGRRLNIFFSENSAFNNGFNATYTGRDFLFNPTDQIIRDQNIFQVNPYDLVLGGHHWIYVTNTPYDECEEIRKKFTPEITSQTGKSPQIGKIAWCGMVMMNTGAKMKSLNEGLIPNDLRVKIRVENPYQTWHADGDAATKYTGHPKYRFKIEGRQSQTLDAVQIENALDSVKVSPNPYYGYSQYEANQFQNIVKITNLPAKATVSIYSIDGKFIRQYIRNEQYLPYKQIAPDVEWDLKNAKGIPVSSGVYLININAPGMGERTIKWFGIARQFDPSGL